MKGVIFNLAEQVITDGSGAGVRDDVLDSADVEGSYTSLGSYPDAQFHALVAAIADRLDVEPQVVVRRPGEADLPTLAARYPRFFDGHASTQAFLLALNDIIHTEVRKVYPGADVPEFGFEVPSEAVLIIHDGSPRRLCMLAEGFIHGAARLYAEQLTLSQEICMLQGQPSCVLRCVFAAA